MRRPAQSAAATALGFARYNNALPSAGVILNRVASPRHERLIRRGMEHAGLTVLGSLTRNRDLALPERHLGLVQAVEHPDLEQAIITYEGFLRDNVDLAALKARATSSKVSPAPALLRPAAPAPPVAPPAPPGGGCLGPCSGAHPRPHAGLHRLAHPALGRLPLTACNSPIMARCLLLMARCSLLIARCSLKIAHCSSLTTHHSLFLHTSDCCY